MSSEHSKIAASEMFEPNEQLLAQLAELPLKRNFRDFFVSKDWQRRKAEHEQLLNLYRFDTHRPSELVQELVKQWGAYEDHLRAALLELGKSEIQGISGEVQSSIEVALLGRQFITKIRKIKYSHKTYAFKLEFILFDKNTFPDSESKSNLPSGVILNSGEVMKRKLTCHVIPTHIQMTSFIMSRDNLDTLYPEARGMATLLMRLSHRINRILKEVVGVDKKKRSARAEIADRSTTGWSGNRASELGYRFEPEERKQTNPDEYLEPDKIWKYDYT